MKVRDESLWQQQCADFAQDPDSRAEPFRKFVMGWAEAAEELISDDCSLIDALNLTLRSVEERQETRWTVGYLGMALVLLSTHWSPAEDSQAFISAMTPIEQSLYFDTLAIKMAELQASAAESSNG